MAHLCSWSEEGAHPLCHWSSTALEEQLSLQHPWGHSAVNTGVSNKSLVPHSELKNPSSAGKKERQKKNIQIQLPWGRLSKQALPGWFGSIPTCQAAAGSCCAQSAAGVWHQNVLVLGSSQGTFQVFQE